MRDSFARKYSLSATRIAVVGTRESGTKTPCVHARKGERPEVGQNEMNPALLIRLIDIISSCCNQSEFIMAFYSPRSAVAGGGPRPLDSNTCLHHRHRTVIK